MVTLMLCNICRSSAAPLSKARILGRHDIQYYVCSACGFIQTEQPYWLDEAYADSIARSDIGLIGRNIKVSNITSIVIRSFYDSDKKFLDYGGGNGMFVRMMRDKGFDFYWSDKFTANQFATGFEAGEDETYELLTAFEVFEHLTEPLVEVEKMLSYSRNILFSTNLIPANRPAPQDWWYYTLDTGQHVSLYSKQALIVLAHKFGLNYYSNGVSIHLFTERRLPPVVFQAVSIPPLSALLSPFFVLGRKSLLEDDYFQITGRRLK
jgi:2-polyprenyl-3-methyl-5-hydroxy-6-metoxy-1,4-benzoquinol methylase